MKTLLKIYLILISSINQSYAFFNISTYEIDLSQAPHQNIEYVFSNLVDYIIVVEGPVQNNIKIFKKAKVANIWMKYLWGFANNVPSVYKTISTLNEKDTIAILNKMNQGVENTIEIIKNNSSDISQNEKKQMIDAIINKKIKLEKYSNDYRKIKIDKYKIYIRDSFKLKDRDFNVGLYSITAYEIRNGEVMEIHKTHFKLTSYNMLNDIRMLYYKNTLIYILFIVSACILLPAIISYIFSALLKRIKNYDRKSKKSK